MNGFDLQNVTIGPDKLTIIAGPCSAESYDLCMQIGSHLQALCQKYNFGYIFKASFDKANRSSIQTPRGLGIDQGLTLINKAARALGCPCTTDIHESHQAQAIGQAVDLIQIPAFLCRQTDLLLAAAKTQRAINVKKGQFLSPLEMSSVVQKLEEARAQDNGIILTERGTFFGYHRLVNDFIGLADMMDLNYPVCFDVTHSTQLPGGASQQGAKITGGRPDRAAMLAKCATAAGVPVLFLETHPNPSQALSDGATMLPLDQLDVLFAQIQAIYHAVNG